MHVRDDIGLVIITAVGNPKLYAFDMYTGEALWVESMGFSKMYDETWTPDGKYIVMNTADMLYTCFNVSKTGLTKLWVSEVQPGMYPWPAFQRGADCASFAYGNMYTVGYDGQVECWDPETGEMTCATCHNHPGECGFGGCFKKAKFRFAFKNAGRVFEIREFCRCHATAPRYGWLRAGAEMVGRVMV